MEQMLDQSVLDQLAEDVGADTLTMLLDSLKTEMLKSQIEMLRFLDQADIPLIENQAHGLKSAARSFGAMQLGEACAVIEHAARANNRDVLAGLIAELNSLIDETLKIMEQSSP